MIFGKKRAILIAQQAEELQGLKTEAIKVIRQSESVSHQSTEITARIEEQDRDLFIEAFRKTLKGEI